MKTSCKLCLAIAASMYLTVAHGGVFSVDTNVSGVQTSASFTSVEDAFNSLSNSGFSSINTAYTGTEAASLSIGYRGLPMTAAYPTVGSPQLLFTIPSLGISEVFVGANRDESEDLLAEYFKQNRDDILGRISRELAAKTGVDPIAGNPNSMMSQMVMQDFNNSFTDHATNIKGDAQENNNLFGVGFRFGQYRQSGLTSRSYTIPLSYTFRNDLDPRRQLSFNMPITLGDVEGSKSFYVALGGSYRFPMNDNWALTPAINVGVAGSADLGALASIGSASLTSSYLIRMDKFDLAIGNMAGYYTTLKVKSGDYSYDPGITNTVVRNGVMLSHPVSIGGRTMSIEYSFIDTHFFGDELFVDHYDEIGISLGTNKRAGFARSYFRSGLTYLYSSESKGFTLNLGYWF
jgi:hypothetical protein